MACQLPFQLNLMLTAQVSLTPTPPFHALLGFAFLVVMVEVILWIHKLGALPLNNSFPIYHSITLIMEMLCRKVCCSYLIAPLHHNISYKWHILIWWNIYSLLNLKGITWVFGMFGNFSFNSFMQSTTRRRVATREAPCWLWRLFITQWIICSKWHWVAKTYREGSNVVVWFGPILKRLMGWQRCWLWWI